MRYQLIALLLAACASPSPDNQRLVNAYTLVEGFAATARAGGKLDPTAITTTETYCRLARAASSTAALRLAKLCDETQAAIKRAQ